MDAELVKKMQATMAALRRTGAAYIEADLTLARTVLLGMSPARETEYNARAHQLARKSLELSHRLQKRLELSPAQEKAIDALRADIERLLGDESQPSLPAEPQEQRPAIELRRLFIGRSHGQVLREPARDQFWELHGLTVDTVDADSGMIHLQAALDGSPAQRALAHDLQQATPVIRNWRLHDRVQRHYVRGWVRRVQAADEGALMFGLFVMAAGDPLLDPPAAFAPTGFPSGQATDKT